MKTAKTSGGWIQSYKGDKVFPLNPQPQDFSLETVAHALALKCRFNGHCQSFYSVAQHAVIVSRFVEPQYALHGLLHELDEVFLPDIPRPIKSSISGWQEILEKNMAVGVQAFNLSLPLPDNVVYVDSQVLHAEKKVLMPNSPEPWEDSLPPAINYHIVPMAWEIAEKMFLERYREIIYLSDSPFEQLNFVP